MIFQDELISKYAIFHQKLNFRRSVQDIFSTAKKPYISNCVRNMNFSKVIKTEPFHDQIRNPHRPTLSYQTLAVFVSFCKLGRPKVDRFYE